ncbi:MAG TPA: hypothetical protein ENI73_02970 [Spirochaetes bacterium]|nr:hypothetical protein [Spirochaetota bacterium]
MTDEQIITFQQALDIIESLPEDQQESLIDIIQRRLIEHRQNILAENIQTAREEYARGEIKKGSVDDLMRELSNENTHLE